MKKPKKYKKNKPKENWLKQVGEFVFKRCIQSGIKRFNIDVYYKNELIGILNTNGTHWNQHFYKLSIYNNVDDTIFSAYRVGPIGEVSCIGISTKGLPKAITNVHLYENSMLVSNRTVLFEKYKHPIPIEL